MWITVGCLFIGRAVTPLASESLDASTTALIEDTTLNITAADLASLSSAGAVCGALGKILAGPTIGIVNGRNAWLMLLLVGTVSMLCIANVTSVGELGAVWMAYTPFAAMAFPATTVIVLVGCPPLPSPPTPPPHPIPPHARVHARTHTQAPPPHPTLIAPNLTHWVDGHLFGRGFVRSLAGWRAPSLVDVTRWACSEDESQLEENVVVSEPESL